MDIATSISKGLAEKAVVAKVKHTGPRVATLDDGLVNTGPDVEEGEDKWELWDLIRPFEGNCELNILTFDDREGKAVYWHSSAHILGECMECDYGVHLCFGPPIESGFFYDAHCGKDVRLHFVYRVDLHERALQRDRKGSAASDQGEVAICANCSHQGRGTKNVRIQPLQAAAHS